MLSKFFMVGIQNICMAKKRPSGKSSRNSRNSRKSNRVKATPDRYDAKFYKTIPSALFGILGLLYLLTPYSKLLELGLDLGKTHSEHLIFGIVFSGIAAAFWFINNKKK